MKTRIMVAIIGLMVAARADGLTSTILSNVVAGAGATNTFTAAVTGTVRLVSFALPASATATVKIVSAYSTLWNATLANTNETSKVRSYLVQGQAQNVSGVNLYPAKYDFIPALGNVTATFIQSLETATTNEWAVTLLVK